MTEKALSMRALSLRAGLKHNTVANLMSRNQHTMNHNHLESLLRVLGTSMAEFWEPDAPPAIVAPPGTTLAAPPAYTVLVPDCGPVEAGPFRLPDIQSTERFVKGTYEDRDAFILTVHGDSMAPDYAAGEVIFLKRENIHLVPLPQDVKVGVPYERIKHLNGKDCVVLMADDGSTFKRLQIAHKHGQEYAITLHPVNPSHSKTVIRPDHDIWIQGVCYKSIRRR